MQFKKLGNSDLEVSSYCLGTMTFGEATSEKDGHEQIDISIDAGINFFDTAEMYPTCPLRPETTGDTEVILGIGLIRIDLRDQILYWLLKYQV